MDLSRPYYCLPHDPLLAKMKAYGFSSDNLKLIHSYLCGRKQRVKIRSTCCSWQEIKPGVPQESVLGPFLLKLFLHNFFYDMQHSQVCNFADYDQSRRMSSLLLAFDVRIPWERGWTMTQSMHVSKTKITSKSTISYNSFILCDLNYCQL